MKQQQSVYQQYGDDRPNQKPILSVGQLIYIEAGSQKSRLSSHPQIGIESESVPFIVRQVITFTPLFRYPAYLVVITPLLPRRGGRAKPQKGYLTKRIITHP